MGQFEHGTITGQGIIVFANGSRYEGEFKDGAFQGAGTYSYADGSTFKGTFKKGLFHGKGTMYSDGQIYEGEFKEGEYYGKGTITYYDKSQEVGEWKEGKFVVSKKIKAPMKKETDEIDQGFGDNQFSPKDSWALPEDQANTFMPDSLQGNSSPEE